MILPVDDFAKRVLGGGGETRFAKLEHFLATTFLILSLDCQ